METTEISITDAKREAKLAEWHRIITECRSSGQKVTDWCREHGIGIKTYYYWHKQVWTRESGAISRIREREQAQFAEIQISRPGSSEIRIQYKQWEISLPKDSNPELAAEIIKAVSHV